MLCLYTNCLRCQLTVPGSDMNIKFVIVSQPLLSGKGDCTQRAWVQNSCQSYR